MMGGVTSPGYLYLFSRVPPGEGREKNGAYHTAEIVYVFGNLGRSPYTYANGAYDATDRRLSNEMSSYWVNFAKTGNPNGEGLTQWPAYARDADQWMEFGDTTKVASGVRTERLDFADRFYARQQTAPR
jgi:para-nitrobenzyl esterase